MNEKERLAASAASLAEKILSVGVNGAGPWKGSIPTAEEHLRQHGDVEKAIDRLIATHVRITAATGFATGVGGLITLPVAIPADMTTLWLMQGRLTGSIAHLRGYDVHSQEVQSLVLVTLLGSSGAEAMAKAGVTLGEKGAAALLGKVPGKVLIEINKKVGFRLLTKAGTTGVLNLTKFVPLAGGAVGGTVNGVSTNAVGAWAKRNFPATGAASASATQQG